ncbi:MAG TPA: GNAT family N-acetyltransferase [Clostridiales bacterium]|nr:GNAT family N-acetyltransferase [Clostridiales bacterium]
MKTLETDRLIIRKFRYEDLDNLYEYARNPKVGPNAGWCPHESREDSSDILRIFIEKDDVWAITDKSTGKVIGSIGLHIDNKRNNDKARMLGYVLAEPYWGKGLMTEAAKAVIKYAFETMELDLLSVYHYPYNQRSKRVIEKCGFLYEGTLRNASVIYNGDVNDDVCYSLTEREYWKLIKNSFG